MSPPRRRGTRPTADDLAGIDNTTTPTPTGRLTKAAHQDPVVGTTPAATDTAPAAAGDPTQDTSSARKPYTKTKVGYVQDADDIARARAAFTWTRAAEGTRSFSDFIAQAVMTEVERLETKHNHGKAWGGMHAGEIPTGRPLE